MKNNVFNEYIRNLKREIPEDYKYAKRFIESISRDLEEYLEENPNASYEDLCVEFGNPNELVGALMDDFDSVQMQEVFVRRKINKKIIYSLAGIVVVLVLLCCVFIPHIGIYITDTVYIYETESTENELGDN